MTLQIAVTKLLVNENRASYHTSNIVNKFRNNHFTKQDLLWAQWANGSIICDPWANDYYT